MLDNTSYNLVPYQNIDVPDVDKSSPVKLKIKHWRQFGFDQKLIKDYTRQKQQNVSRFYQKNKEEIEYIRDETNQQAIDYYTRIEFHAAKHQLSKLVDVKEKKKISASQSAVIGSIATQNKRLYKGESTQNVAIDTVRRSAGEKLVRIRELEAEGVEVV